MKQMYLPLLICLGMLLIEVRGSTSTDPFSDEFIIAINKQQTIWKAGRNFGKNTLFNYVAMLMGRNTSKKQSAVPELNHKRTKVGNEFDWRDYYSNCSSIRNIADQGACGCCWAFATVEVISDRICIHSDGKTSIFVSADDLLSCCKNCGYGCNGGYEVMAFKYWVNNGIVSGGPYGSHQGCRPYEIAPCEQSRPVNSYGCSKRVSRTPKCKRSCQRGYSISYEEDLYFGKTAYRMPRDVNQIQVEISTNGPVAASFDVYEDFLHYRSGVYKHVLGEYVGGHAVKILGWGVENTYPYWLAANSWSAVWGDNGFFKIFRGDNQCGIESDVVAGIPA